MHQLSAFIKEAEAQKSKKISDEHAEALITATQWIINNIWNNGL